MRRGLKKKRVSWASDVNLCQIRMFLSDESPSQVGLSAQDHLQAKKSWLLHSNGVSTDDNLPPGFESAQAANELENMLSELPVTKWRFPHRLILNVDWQVVAGEESKEVELQNQREMRILEAVYPRPSAIPQNPALSMAMEDYHHNDGQAPLIPINPIEDEEVVTSDASCDLISPMNPFVNSNPSTSEKLAAGKTLDEEPDVAATASAALSTAIMKTNKSLINHDLLIKLLNNPSLIQNMIKDYGADPNPQTTHHPLLSPVNQTSNPSLTQINGTETSTSLKATANGNFQTHSNGVMTYTAPRPPPPPPGMVPVSVPPSVVASKDFNYYQTLIHHHGGERQTLPQFVSHHINESSRTNQGSFSNPTTTKIMKQCMYFNSSRGCRNGANCVFQHDSKQQQATSMPEVQNAKKFKFDKEITGT